MNSHNLIQAIILLNTLSFIFCYNYNDDYKNLGSYDDAVEFRPHHLKHKSVNDQMRNAKISELDFMNKKLIQEIIERELREIEKEKLEKNDVLFGGGDVSDVSSSENTQILQNNPEFKQSASFMVNDQQQKADFSDVLFTQNVDKIRNYDKFFYVIVAGCAFAGMIAVVATGFCLYTMRKSIKNSANIEFPAYSVKKQDQKQNSTIIVGDRRLAQSAQMYHYQHQKQQMIAMEKANNDMKNEDSESSDEETEEGDYTVYECPGLAPTGEIEVKNPLFKEDFDSPVTLLDLTNSQTPNIQETPLTPQIQNNSDTNSSSNNTNITTPGATVPQTTMMN